MHSIETFWASFCKARGQSLTYKEAYQFGVEPNKLAKLVVDGKKTATCSNFLSYEIENDLLPQVGEYSIILDGDGTPVAIIEITNVFIQMFKDIPKSFALAEGEGTYEEWRQNHVEFFENYLADQNRTFTDEELTVCEEFIVVYK